MIDGYSDVVTVNELKDILRIGKNTAYKLIKTNAIKHVRIGNKILIPKQCVIEFLQSNT